MIDVKKLIGGFLILAVAASAAALIITNTGSAQPKNNTATISAVGTNSQAAQPVALSGSAFLPTAQNPTPAVVIDANSSTDAIANDPNNLTNILTNTYLSRLVSANPNGPATDANGQPSLAPPDTNSVLAQFDGSSSLASVRIPDWDAEAARVAMNITSAVSSGSAANYTIALQDIFDKNFVGPNLQNVLGTNADASAASYVGPKLENALRDIAGLETPAPAKNFQKQLIRLLVYEKNTIALVGGSANDPVKSALVLQGEKEKYNQVIDSFKTEFQKLSALNDFSPITRSAEKNPITAFVNTFFGIRTAHALFGVGDITFDPALFGQVIIDYANNIILQILKNVIINLMNKTVLKWVQGNGVPRFIQNWGTLLVNSYERAAVNALDQQFSCINPAFAPQLKLLLKINTPSANGGGNVCAVQFPVQLAGNNLTNFYNNFQNGGFVSYLALFQPGGNLFGASIDVQDYVMNAAAQSQQAAQTKAIANQGYKGSQVCTDGSDPNGSHLVCGDGTAPEGGSEFCDDGTNPVLTPNSGTCDNGKEPITTTPGQVTGQVFNSAIDSGSKLVTAANDIVGLLNAFLTSMLNSLANNAITAATGAINNIGTGGGTANNATQGSVPISCTVIQNSSNPKSITFVAAGGQTINGTNANSTFTTPQYTWSAPGGNPPSGSGNNFATTFSVSGTYTVTVTDTVDNVSKDCIANVP